MVARATRRACVHEGLRAPIALCVAVLALGCDPPNVDVGRSGGGPVPDPTAVLEGTILYVGPRPICDYDGLFPVRVRGNVVLTLFDYDNPPPPVGSATSAVSLLTVPGDELFTLEDCSDGTAPIDPSQFVMRSAAWIWPEIPLGNAQNEACRGEGAQRFCPPRAYQIRGFFDRDQDFLPFFGVSNLPTAGDIAGAALVSTTSSVYRQIVVGRVEDHPNGNRVTGIAVTLGAPVGTERPIFELDEQTRALESTAAVVTLNPEPTLRTYTNARIRAIVSAAQTAPSQDWIEALAAARIDSSNYRFGVPQYAFYATPINVDPMPGEQDPHPILGTVGYRWFTPLIVLRRAKSPIEQQLGLPDVLIVPTAPQSELRAGQVSYLDFEMLVPPVASIVTNPNEPVICRNGVFAPTTAAGTFSLGVAVGRWIDCQELPTGNYDVNVLAGVAGGVPIPLDMSVADNGFGFCQRAVDVPPMDGGCSGSFSSQAWTIPNDLGCPDVSYRIGAVNQLDPVRPDGTLPACGDADSAMLPSQSRQGAFAVVDSSEETINPRATTGDHGNPMCPTAPGSYLTPSEYHQPPMQPGAVPSASLELCCPPTVLQFCGLPLCPLRDGSTEGYPVAARAAESGARMTREIRVPNVDYIVLGNGAIQPLCTPFLMPAACCAAAGAP